MSKKVSIIVPVYNQEKYIAATLDHIVHQDYDNLEIIVCDDCSTDGTKKIIKEWLPRQGRFVNFFEGIENIGGAMNCNRAFTYAKGDYLTYISGDDIPYPNMISTLVEKLEETGADFAYSDMFIVDDAGRILRKFALPNFDFEESLVKWYFLGVSKLWKRELYDKHGGFDPAIKSAGDYELFLRYAMAGANMEHVPEVLMAVRAHGQDRKTGLHTPEMESVAMQESAMLAERARAFLRRDK